MLKWRKYIKKHIFFGISLFFAIFGFSENFIKKVGQNLSNNSCPFFTMLTKQNSSKFCIVSFVKKTKGKWFHYLRRLAHTLTHGLFSRATCPRILKLVYFQGRPAHTLTLVCFHGRPAHTLTLVYFHGRPAHTYSLWVVRLNWDPFVDPLQPEPKNPFQLG